MIACTCAVCRSLDFRDQRLRTSIHVATDALSLVVDTGPDFRQQMLRAGVGHLDAVLFTHAHKDHTAGLDDVRAYNHLQQADMPVYGRAAVLAQLRQEYAYVFAEKKYPGIPQLTLHEIDEQPFCVGDQRVVPVAVSHYQLPVLGFRFGDFTYITDANHIGPEELDKVRGSRFVVLNALRQTPHISHFSLDEAVALLTELCPEKGYLTHISHLMGTHREVSAQLPDFVELAYDGLTIEC